MNIEKVFNRLEELFPNDIVAGSYTESPLDNTYFIEMTNIKNHICLYYDKEDPNNITMIDFFVDGLYGDNLNPVHIFDLENHLLHFKDFDRAKKFIKKHNNFPKKMFYNQDGSYTFIADCETSTEIPDITKVHKVAKVCFEED